MKVRAKIEGTINDSLQVMPETELPVEFFQSDDYDCYLVFEKKEKPETEAEGIETPPPPKNP